MHSNKPKLIRITTVPLSLKYLLAGQMKYMNENGLEVTMISSDGPERDYIIEAEGCPHIIVPMTRKITPLQDAKSLWHLFTYFKKAKPDIVHSHTPKAGLLAMIAAKMAGVRIRIHTVAGLRFMTTTGVKRQVLIFVEKLTAQAATHIWPNSPLMLSYMLQNKLSSPAKTQVIGYGSSNGIDMNRFSPEALNIQKLENIKAHIGYKNSDDYLLFVGRIVADKGLKELAGAFTTCAQKHPGLRLLILGAFEDDLDPIDAETKTFLTTHPAIQLIGWTEDVAYYMHLAFALIHPSHREGFPNVLLQAGAMRCNIICSDIDGNTDIVEDGKTGLLFQTKNTARVIEKIEFALNNRSVMNHYKETLYQKIKTHFSQPAVHKLMLDKYLELLKQKSR